jgi:hypothetical protein
MATVFLTVKFGVKLVTFVILIFPLLFQLLAEYNRAAVPGNVISTAPIPHSFQGEWRHLKLELFPR